MNWYYSNEDGKQLGPINDAEFQEAVRVGTIHLNTLVWRDGLQEWVKYSRFAEGADINSGTCDECGGSFKTEDMLNFEGVWVCAACKPIYMQKLREGVPTGSMSGGWRSGKVLITRLNANLPTRCVKCNEPDSGPQIKRKLYWHHPLIYLGLLLRIVGYVILAMIFRKKSVMMITVCQKHRKLRRNTILASWLLVLVGIAAVTAGAINETMWALITGGLLFLAGIIYGIARGRLVYATKIDKEYVRVGGCGPSFLASFPEWNK